MVWIAHCYLCFLLDRAVARAEEKESGIFSPQEPIPLPLARLFASDRQAGAGRAQPRDSAVIDDVYRRVGLDLRQPAFPHLRKRSFKDTSLPRASRHG